MATRASQSSKGKQPESRLTFEQALARLEEIVSRLEAGEEELEQSLQLFEEGMRLSRFCRERLSAAQTKLEQLVEKAGGLVDTSPVEPDEDATAS